MTVAEAAAFVSVSTRTVRRLIAEGALDRVKIGRSVRLRSSRTDLRCGTLQTSFNHALIMFDRERIGREASPTAAMITLGSRRHGQPDRIT